MARVCISCGLTTDSQGRLIVNTGGAEWEYACAESNGVPIVCGSDGVLRSGMPEKFHVREQEYSSTRNGLATSATFGSPTPGGGSVDFGDPMVIVLENPSDCLPMRVAVRFGIHHMAMTKTGSGNTSILVGVDLTVTGGIVATNEAHQQWRHDGSVNAMIWDTQNGTETLLFDLAAGATATFSAQNHIIVTAYNGNTNITNHLGVLDVEAWN